MELDNVIARRRSVRCFQAKPVAKADIEAMIQSAIFAPSWKNLQTTRYAVVMDQERLAQVKACLPAFNQENVKDAPVLIVTSFVKDMVGFNKQQEAVNELGNGWGCYDCGLHNMQMILKATQLGLGTLIMGIRDGAMLHQVLDIPDDQQIVSVIAVGYYDKEIEMPKRKTIAEITRFY
ncbi:MAG: nitroreductase family protein [Erysipelotrichaceae bacterium]|nr:nitroreductase family protein [Erysipelotrichaceae bacterium]MDY5251240.1 nitroreductase family protein [Erysipelotrichaceae bacterium]